MLNTFTYRIDIWRDTIFRAKRYKFKDSIKLNDLDIEPPNDLNNLKLWTPLYDKTIVEVINKDTINSLIDLINEGLKPVLLNTANDRKPGSMIDVGAMTQEENIFRRTNYHLTLLKKYYPIENNQLIYSPLVSLFRTDEENSYQILDEPYHISIIASAAINCPAITSEGDYLFQKDKDIMLNKIRLIFKTAYKYGHDSIVLSAFGTGSFYNPPHIVAHLFKQVLQEFDGCFKKIVFAILDLEKLAFKTNNFEIFNNIINCL